MGISLYSPHTVEKVSTEPLGLQLRHHRGGGPVQLVLHLGQLAVELEVSYVLLGVSVIPILPVVEPPLRHIHDVGVDVHHKLVDEEVRRGRIVERIHAMEVEDAHSVSPNTLPLLWVETLISVVVITHMHVFSVTI